MIFDLILKNGLLTTSGGIERADVGIVDGLIAEIGDLQNGSAGEILDLEGLHVLPGVIDSQVHFRDPGLTHKEDLETGTRAAVLGGVTTIFDEPNTNPTTTSTEALQAKLGLAEGRAWCDYAFWVGAATDNLLQLAELDRLEGSPGIGEVFMGSSTGPLLVSTDEDLRQVLLNGSRRCAIHAEDEFRNSARRRDYEAGVLQPDPSLGYAISGTVADHPHVRDAESARLATERIINLAEETGRPIHILHLSTADEIPLIENARVRGVDVTTEITPQHLWFSAPECYKRLGSLAQMNPPVRSRGHQEALRDAFQRGFFSVVGSDHAPHTREEKQRPYPQSPSGLTGVQTLLPVMLTLVQQGLCDLPKLVQLTSENPALLFGLLGKGRIEEGLDADLVCLNPSLQFIVEEKWIASRCGWSPYVGETLYGRPVHTILRGSVVVRDGIVQGAPAGRAARFSQVLSG